MKKSAHNWRNKLRFRYNRQTTVFLVCVLISTFIWFLITLSKPYTTFVSFEVAYTNIPEDQLVVKKLPDEIAVRVTAQGFTLLSWKMGLTGHVLNIDVSKFREVQHDNYAVVTVVPGDLVDEISTQLGGEANINRENILPKAIDVMLSQKATRSVPVRTDVEIEMLEDYALDGTIQAEPLVVDVTGPKVVLDTLQAVYTEKLTLSGLDEPQDLVARIRLPQNIVHLSAEPEKVFVKVPVDQFVPGRIVVPIAVRNMPDSMALLLFPDSVAIDYTIGMHRSVLSKSQFSAEIDVPDTAQLNSLRKLQVSLMKHPEYIRVLRYEPRRVEFIQRKE